MSIRLLVVQFAGDYRATFRTLAKGGDESYFAQRYSDDAIASHVREPGSVMVLTCLTDEPYSELLPNGVLAVGLGPKGTTNDDEAVRRASTFKPSHLLLRAPFLGLLRWGIDSGCDVALTLADSFNGTGLRSWWYERKLKRLLNASQVRWVGNHGASASESLARLGVSPQKIIPWDWPHQRRPDQMSPKTAPAPGSVWKLLFVGAVSELKGVADLLHATAALGEAGRTVRLTVAGGGQVEAFVALSQKLGIADRVTFLGPVPNREVVALMRESDVVVVPSRTAYPEGFPLTIYEALSARTPLVASDHPMFRSRLRHDETAVVFRSGDAADLAHAVEHLIDRPDLYAELSRVAEDTWNRLQIPVKWADLVSAWIDGRPENEQWLRSHAWSNRPHGQ